MQDALERISHFGPQAIIDKIRPFISEARFQRMEEVLMNRRPDVRLALEGVSDRHNAWACVRSAEAFGVDRVGLIAFEGKAKMSLATSAGSAAWMEVERFDTLDTFAKGLEGSLLVGADINGDCLLDELPLERPLCFLFGNENRGLSDSARVYCDMLYRIPMVGMTESLNLSVACAISLYSHLQRRPCAPLVKSAFSRRLALWCMQQAEKRRLAPWIQRQFPLP